MAVARKLPTVGELSPATALERASEEASNKIQVLLTIGFSCSIGTQKLLVDLFTFYTIQNHHVGFSPTDRI